MALTSYKVLITTGTFTNCYCNYQNNEFLDTNKQFFIYANSGAIFEGAFQYKLGTTTKTFKNNGSNLTIESTSFSNNITLYKDYIATGGTTSFTLTQTLNNCVSNISGATIDEQENKEIILTCNSGYIFNEKPTITIGDIEHDFILNENKTIATITININDNVVINGIGSISYLLDYKVTISGTIENATCNYSDGDFLDSSKPLIISANVGYNFKNSYTYKRGTTTQTMVNNGSDLRINTTSFSDNIDLNKVYNATKEIEQIGGFTNLYKVTQLELTELSKKRIVVSSNGAVDYGTYINSLYILPFDLPTDLLGDRSNIILGNLNSNVESTLISSYMFDVAGGSITIPLKYNNIYDFVNTECILHFPFLDKLYINSEYVIGQVLTFDFTIELYSGNLTINVTSSFNDEIVASVQGLIGMNIPFIQRSNGGVINSLSNVYKNNINRCFIEVNRNIPYTKNTNVFGGSVVEYGKIADYTGYLECDNLVIETSATNQEQEEIKNIMRKGVFI